jgi:hypothetical protein
LEAMNFQPDIKLMKNSVSPWIQSLENPEKAQEIALEGLLKNYGQTEYGRNQHSENVGSYKDYKQAFPVKSYEDFKPLINQVMDGQAHVLLNEEPINMILTKGTTGESKLFPYIPAQNHKFIESCKRIYYSYAITENKFDWLSGYRLTLSSSGNLGSIKVGQRELRYGYGIGVTIGLTDKANGLPNLVTPTQEEMNTILGESSKKVWEERYEFAYQKGRNKNVTHIQTGYNYLLGFGNYIYREHNIHPKDLWNVRLLVLGGYPGSNIRYNTALKALYGKSFDIREIYLSSEGVYGGQVDEKKAWVPFYDFAFFEIQTINGIKLLHEMTPGEIGCLIVSTQYLPRYRLGDLILAFESPYFRCIGRENTKLHPYHFGNLKGKSPYKFPKSTHLHSWR